MFFARLAPLLASYRLRFQRLDAIDFEAFENLRTERTFDSEDIYIGSITNEHGAELILAAEHPSWEMRRYTRSDEEYVPSIGFLIRNQAYRLLPYRRPEVTELEGLREIAIQPGAPTAVNILVDQGVARLNTNAAAEIVAELVAKAFARDFVPVTRYRFLDARRLPKIHGGPG